MNGNEKVILKKENGVVSKVEKTPKFRNEIGAIMPHLCGEECVNASPLTCSKFAHKNMKAISEYDYITDGFSIQKTRKSETGETVPYVERLRVTGCENYVKAVPTKQSYTKRCELIASIYTNYYDAESIEEALEIQEDILDRQHKRFRSGR